MGRHSAPDGPSAPLLAGDPGGLGWPGPSPGERGLGWPEKDPAEAGDDTTSAARPRGWRRFFRLSPAA